MATISEFLVALSLDGKGFEKGLKEAEAGLQLFSATALQVGAVVAGALSFKSLTVDFSKQNLELDQMAKKIGVTRDEIYGLDQAAQAFGANAGESTKTLERLAAMRAGLLRGEIGAIESVAKSGLDPDTILTAKNPYEALLNIAARWKKLTKDQRFNLANDLGISPAQMELLLQGRKKIREMSEEFVKNRKHTDEMSDAAHNFTRQWVELTNNVGGAIDPLAQKFTELSTELMKFFTEGSKDGSEFRDVMKYVAEHLEWVAGAIGLILAAKPAAQFALMATGIARMAASLGALVAIEGLATTVTVLGRLATVVKALSIALFAMTKLNPWLLGLTALVGVATAPTVLKGLKGVPSGLDKLGMDDDKAKKNVLGETDEDQGEYLQLLRENYTPDEIDEIMRQRALDDGLSPTHEAAKATIERTTAPQIVQDTREEYDVSRTKPQTELKQNKDGTKTMTVNLVLDGKVIDRRVFDIVGNAIKVANETGRSTTAR